MIKSAGRGWGARPPPGQDDREAGGKLKAEVSAMQPASGPPTPQQGPVTTGWPRAPGTAHCQGDPSHPEPHPSSPKLCSRDAVLEGGRGLVVPAGRQWTSGADSCPELPFNQGKEHPRPS